MPHMRHASRVAPVLLKGHTALRTGANGKKGSHAQRTVVLTATILRASAVRAAELPLARVRVGTHVRKQSKRSVSIRALAKRRRRVPLRGSNLHAWQLRAHQLPLLRLLLPAWWPNIQNDTCGPTCA